MNLHSQFSLRELLLVVLFAGIGLASLRAGGVVGTVTVFLAMVTTLGMAIVAFVERGKAQAFAIGFLIPVIGYAAIVRAVGQSELDPFEGKLPTSRLLRPMYRAIVKQTWINTVTGEELPNYDPAADPDPAGVGGPFGGSSVMLSESLDRETFMSLGHVFIAMMMGYVGARFAAALERRRRAPNGRKGS